MKSVHEIAVEKSDDEMIRFLGERPSGIRDYAIGRKITVSWRGGDRYLCHTCVVVFDGERKGCVHSQRIAKYRAQNEAA